MTTQERPAQSNQKSNQRSHRIKRLLPTIHVVGHYDWCHACVGGTGRSDAHKRQREEQNSSVCGGAWITGSCLMDRNQHRKVTARSPREPLRFLVVKVKPRMEPRSERGKQQWWAFWLSQCGLGTRAYPSKTKSMSRAPRTLRISCHRLVSASQT